MKITSTHNAWLKSVRRAAATGQVLEDGSIVAEGPHLLEEALRSQWIVSKIITTLAGLEKYQELVQASQAEVVQVSGQIFAATASTQTAQEILTLLYPRSWRFPELLRPPALLVALDAVQDPGNAGTIVRSAEAFGATGIILLQGCVRPSNGKFLRAAAGSLFRLPLLDGISSQDLIRQASESRITMYALAASGQRNMTEIDFRQPCCLITGNEGAGISEDMLTQSLSIRVPTHHVESLNAGVACSLALFEAYRQRAL